MNSNTPAPKRNGWINLAVDYGPLLVFFLSYRFYRPEQHDIALEIGAVIRSTLAFILASLAAVVISRWRLGRVSPMLWLSTALIVGFGALTVYTGDQWWIQRKPTAIYVLFAVALLGGWLMGKALLKFLLEAAFDGLSEHGWLLLSRNWGFFFIALAALNEFLAHLLSFEAWLAAKLWVFMPLSFLFTFANLPMLLRHGLSLNDKAEVIENPPTE